MPPLNEGMIYYMPTTLPGISATQATMLLQMQDRILKTFPEVYWVFGKTGRAEKPPTDPAPFSMGETTVMLKPESEWRKVGIDRSHWPQPFRYLGELILSPTRTMDMGRAGRRNGQEGPADRSGQRLDHADQKPHRHAFYRNSNARSGLRSSVPI